METSIIEYKSTKYECREIADLDNVDGDSLTVAPVALLTALEEDYGQSLENCPLDESIFYYADEEAMQLTDLKLFHRAIA